MALAQDEALRAAASADREVAEERYRQLNSAVEGLVAGHSQLVRRLQKMEEMEQTLQRLRSEVATKTTGAGFVAREDFVKLAETVQEIDRKREADKKEILAQIAGLERSLQNAISAISRRAASSPPAEPREPRSEERSGPPPANQEGAWHTIQKGDTMVSIVAAYNESYQKEGKRTSLSLLREANPGVKPESMALGKRIFVPLVPIK